MPSENAGLKGHIKVNILEDQHCWWWLTSGLLWSPRGFGQFVCKSGRPATVLLSKSGTWAAGLLKSTGPAKTFLKWPGGLLRPSSPIHLSSWSTSKQITTVKAEGINTMGRKFRHCRRMKRMNFKPSLLLHQVKPCLLKALLWAAGQNREFAFCSSYS